MLTANPTTLVTKMFARAFEVRERLSVSAWAQRHRVVKTGGSPGPWDNDRTPYLVGVMDAFSDPHVRRVTLMKAEQVGGTEAIINALAWAIVQMPGPVLYIYPNQDVAGEVNRKRMLPALRAIDQVRELLGAERRDSSIFELGFLNGANVKFTGSNSDANTESFPYRFVLVDEVDRCVPGIEGKTEGRVTDYPDHKRVGVGTPGDEEVGIDAAYAASDKRRWWTPCPACGEFHIRDDFSRVGWPMPEGKPFGGAQTDSERAAFLDTVEREAWYACPNETCEHKIRPHEHRATSLRGVWAAEGFCVEAGEACDGDDGEGVVVWRGEGEPPTQSSHAGFHIAGEMSTIAANPWGKIAREFVAKRGHIDRDWANRRRGKAWGVSGRRLEVRELRRLCTPEGEGGYLMGHCPPGTLALTLAADIQERRLYYEVRAWGERALMTGLVDCGELPLGEGGSLDVLEAVLLRRYPVWNEEGKTLPVGAAALDSGFFTEKVYSYVQQLRRRGMSLVWPIKGDGSKAVTQPLRETDVGETTKVARFRGSGLKLLLAKSNFFKQSVMDRIAGERSLDDRSITDDADLAAPRFLLPGDTPDEYLVHLTSERRVTKLVNGVPVWAFEVREGMGNRNHWFDACYYNHALGHQVRVETLMAPRTEAEPVAARERRTRESKYGGRGYLDR